MVKTKDTFEITKKDLGVDEQIKSGQSKISYAVKLAYKAITKEDLKKDIIDKYVSLGGAVSTSDFDRDYLSLPDNLKELYYTTQLPEAPAQEFIPLDQTDVSKLYMGIFGRASEGS